MCEKAPVYHPMRWELDKALKENMMNFPFWSESEWEGWFDTYQSALDQVQMLESPMRGKYPEADREAFFTIMDLTLPT